MIPLTQPTIADGTQQALGRVLKSNRFSSGPEVALFEEEWASYCGMEYGVATSSGTTAIEVAARALGIGKDDSVLIPAFTCIPVAVPFLHSGVDVHMVDCGDDGDVTAKSIGQALSLHRDAKAVVLVHTYGNPVSQSVFDLCRREGKLIIEDTCEAHGVPVQGDVAVFSFRGDKMITSGGTGGMCITNDEQKAAAMKEYVLLGLTGPTETRYDATCIGNGIQMGEIQAAFGRQQLPLLERLISVRRWVAGVYDRELNGVRPSPRPDGSVVWRYMVEYDGDRTAFIQALRKRGVEAMASFRSLGNVLSRLNGLVYEPCPVSDRIGDRNLCLPVWGDMPESAVNKVVEAVNELCG